MRNIPWAAAVALARRGEEIDAPLEENYEAAGLLSYNLASASQPRRDDDRMDGCSVGWLDGRTKESYKRGRNRIINRGARCNLQG